MYKKYVVLFAVCLTVLMTGCGVNNTQYLEDQIAELKQDLKECREDQATNLSNDSGSMDGLSPDIVATISPSQPILNLDKYWSFQVTLANHVEELQSLYCDKSWVVAYKNESLVRLGRLNFAGLIQMGKPVDVEVKVPDNLDIDSVKLVFELSTERGIDVIKVVSVSLARQALDYEPVLELDLAQLSGDQFLSQDVFQHVVTVVGTELTDEGRVFTGDDYIQVAGSDEFTAESGELTALVWIKPDKLFNYVQILNRGAFKEDGWYFNVTEDGTLVFNTEQPGGHQRTFSAPGVINVDSWQQVGFVLSGASVRLYVNGRDVTYNGANHESPFVVERDLFAGSEGNTSNTYSGIMGKILMFDLALPEEHMLQLYSLSKEMYP